MISKSQIKFVQSLKQKKFRDLHRCFVAEGSKLVLEFSVSHFSVVQVFAVAEWLSVHPVPAGIVVGEVTHAEMERISFLSTPSPALAVIEMPEALPEPTFRKENLTLVLDGITDPGNLGTIIRIADWFGIRHLVCSEGCVDQYNPKVVQATMGSLTRVNVNYLELPGFLASVGGEVPIYGMMLEGEDLFTTDTTGNGLIVIGSEAHGISEAVSEFVTHKISIPFYPSTRKTHAESLNAAVATGIVCAEFRRKSLL